MIHPVIRILIWWGTLTALGSASAAVLHVDVNSTNPIPPYVSWATAANVIQDAVDAAVNGDEVLVTNGVYEVGGRAIDDGITNRVAATVPISLRSVNGPKLTTIRGYQIPGTIYGRNAVRGVYLTNGASLAGFTVTGGGTAPSYFGDVSGGGIYCADNSVVISNCVITDNAASLLGGGSLGGTFYQCLISNNTAVGYSEGSGAGVAHGIINNCIIVENTGIFGGGVIYCTVNNSLITGNFARYSGGGAYWSTLINCTVTANSADQLAGGVYESTLTNCIVYYNAAAVSPNHYGDYTGAFYYSCTTPLPATGSNNITNEPLLASFTHLSAASPCRATGATNVATGVDIDGTPWNDPPSMGCDEYAMVDGPLLVAVSASETNAATGYGIPFQAELAGNVSDSYWDFNDGTVLSNRPIVIHQWDAPGDYLVKFHAFNASHPYGVSATAIVHVVNAPVHHVNIAGTNPQPPYLTWATAATSIQDAVDAAYAGGTVLVTNGTYNTGARILDGETNRLAITRPLSVRSVGGATVTVINGGGQMRCVYLTNGAALTGFTVTNGYSFSGAGLACESKNANISNCIIRGNFAAYAGGIEYGTLFNCLLTDNSASSSGGAAYYSTLNNCTVVSNRATGNFAGGTYRCEINNSIIYYNTAPSYPNNAFSGAINYSCTTPLPETGSNNIISGPLFQNSAAGDYQLATNSPCRDAGNNDFAPPGLDLAGNPRTFGSAVDMGAYEYTYSNVPPVAFSQIVRSAAAMDTVVALSGADTNNDALSFRIVTLPGAGTLYQYAAGARGAAITNLNTSVSDPVGRVIFTAATNVMAPASTSFEFLAHDGLLDSAPALVTVNLVAEAPFAHTLPAQLLSPDTFRLAGMATPNGLPSVAWLELGQHDSYTNISTVQAIGAGLDVVHVTAPVSGLAARETFRCRLVVSNQAGITYAAPHQFRTGGKVYGWGNNDRQQTNVPTRLHDALGIAAVSFHSLALRENGRVIAWGGIFSSMATNVPASLSNVTAIATGNEHGLALRSDGTLVAWGNNLGGEVAIPANLSNVVNIAASYRKSAALQANGRARIWGELSVGIPDALASLSNVVAVAPSYNYFGQLVLLHDGTVQLAGYEPYLENLPPPGLSNVVAIAAGASHWLALRRDGSVIGWGSNFAGQTNVPSGLTNVIAIQAGYSQSLALCADGTVVTWGAFSPEISGVFPAATNVATIAAGSGHNLAIVPNHPPTARAQNLTNAPNGDFVIQLAGNDPDGDSLEFVVQTLPTSASLYQFTNGIRGARITSNLTSVTDPQSRLIFAPVFGGLGNPYDSFTFSANDGELTSAPVSVAVSLFATASAFTRPAHEITLTSAKLNGFVSPNDFATTAWFEWGTNISYGQTTPVMDVGSGSAGVFVTQQLAGLDQGRPIHFRLVASNASQVVYGADQQFVTSGKISAWGDNSSSQSATPTNLGAIVSVSGGLSHSLALRADGTVAAWGNNTHGQTNIPGGLNSVTAIAAGGFHNLALLTNGNVVAWGRNNFGQSIVPASASNVIAIAAGGQHSIALHADGTLIAWGDNSQGQRNISAALTNIVGVAAGWFHNVALRSDGTVTAWGANTYGQTTVPAGLTNVVWVGAGLYHSLALRQDGTLLAWGLNSSGQTNLPSNATNLVAAAGGGSHNLAQRADGLLLGWANNSSGQATSPAAVSNIVTFAAGGAHSLALMPNHLPVALDQVAVGYPNTDVLITLQSSDGDNDPVTHRIRTVPTAGTLYQFLGGGRGAAIILPDTSVSDLLGRLIFAPEANQSGSPHAAFDFVASDGFGFSAPANVTVNIILPSAPVLDLPASGVTNNQAFRLAFTGATNAAYRVWASTNLVNWELLGPATTSAPGQFLFLDLTATNWPQRFYRATAP